MQRAIRPDWLIRQAEELAGRFAGGGQPRNANLRRAVSAAYYALFHHMVSVSTLALLPSDTQEADRLQLTRNYEHRSLLSVCERVSGTSSLPRLTGFAIAQLRQNVTLVDVAGTFKDLQQARHEADYDHLASFSRPGVLTLIDGAKDAILEVEHAAGVDRPITLRRSSDTSDLVVERLTLGSPHIHPISVHDTNRA